MNVCSRGQVWRGGGDWQPARQRAPCLQGGPSPFLCFKCGRPGADQTGARRRLICGISPMSRDSRGVAGEGAAGARASRRAAGVALSWRRALVLSALTLDARDTMPPWKLPSRRRVLLCSS